MAITIVKTFAAIGFLLLLAATLVLGWLNRGERIYVPLVTAAVTGIATALVALMASLKATEIRDEFISSAVVQVSDGRGPVLFPSPEAPSVGLRLNSLSALINSPAVPETALNTSEGVTAVVLEAFQYQLVRTLCDIQGGGWSIAQIGSVAQPSVTAAPPHLETEALSPTQLSAALGGNRFAALEGERMLWKLRPLKMPAHTSLRLRHVPSSPATGSEQRIVLLERPGYFVVSIGFSALGGPHGAVPPGVEVPPGTSVASLRSEFVKVTVEQTFHKWTAASQRAEEYKAWVAWLVAQLRARLSDPIAAG